MLPRFAVFVEEHRKQLSHLALFHSAVRTELVHEISAQVYTLCVKGSMIRGLVELLDCWDDHYHVVLSCVRAPWTWGLFMCLNAVFLLPNVG